MAVFVWILPFEWWCFHLDRSTPRRVGQDEETWEPHHVLTEYALYHLASRVLPCRFCTKMYCNTIVTALCREMSCHRWSKEMYGFRDFKSGTAASA